MRGVGSVVALVGVLAMYWVAGQNTGVYTFDMLEMEKAGFSTSFQNFWFLPVFLGFAVLGGIWPFHNWSPDGHVAAPTAVSMFHAGVLMKLGAFAALRVGIMLLPEGAQQWQWLIMALAAIAVVYGAYIAFVQKDLKYMIGFSSVSHMGLVMLGFSTLNPAGLTGAGVQMFSHGVMTALFFAVTGMIYDRAHTRQIPELGGMARIMPFAAIGGVIALWISGEFLSVPASVGFIALLGIAVLNGVVMVSYFNQLHAQGMVIEKLVVEGAKRRLRPVLMTASIAAFGLVPAALLGLDLGKLIGRAQRMRERLRHLGGHLRVISGPTGTTVEAHLPVSGGNTEAAPHSAG